MPRLRAICPDCSRRVPATWHLVPDLRRCPHCSAAIRPTLNAATAWSIVTAPVVMFLVMTAGLLTHYPLEVVFLAAWSAGILLAGVSFLLTYPFLTRYEHLDTQPTCPWCNYDLRATPTHCPECGTRFRCRS